MSEVSLYPLPLWGPGASSRGLVPRGGFVHYREAICALRGSGSRQQRPLKSLIGTALLSCLADGAAATSSSFARCSRSALQDACAPRCGKEIAVGEGHVPTLREAEGFSGGARKAFRGGISKSILHGPRQVLAINAHKMAPRMNQWLQERTWNAPTNGFAWVGGMELAPMQRGFLVTASVTVRYRTGLMCLCLSHTKY